MGKFKTGLGGQLLSEASRAVPKNPFIIKHLPIDEIHENEHNEFSMEEIEDLKQSIQDVGLQQNLVVVPDETGYTLLTGHRRFRALTELYNEGHSQWQMVPCVVKDLDSVKLQISDEAKELYLIATTNVEQRKLTPSDCINAMKMLDVVYDELQAAGEYIGKRRDFMAQRLGISPRTVQNLITIDKKLSDEIKPAFDKEQVPVRVATQMAKLPEEIQNDIWQRKGTETTEEDVKALTDLKRENHAVNNTGSVKRTLIGYEEFEELRESCRFPAIDFNKTVLSESDLTKLQKEKKNILASIRKIEKLLDKAVKSRK